MGRHWLEREPDQSPGLRRIRDARQAATAARTQEKQRVREAETATQEAGQKRLEMLARIEQRTAQVTPLLEEIRDYANQTGTYPVALTDDLYLQEGTPQIVKKADILRARRRVVEKELRNPAMLPTSQSGTDVKDLEEIIDLRYGFRGREHVTSVVGTGDYMSEVGGVMDVTFEHGLRLKIIGSTGKIELLRRKTVRIPARGGRFSSSFEHDEIVDDWQPLPTDDSSRKKMLADAFYDPIRLGGSDLPFISSAAHTSGVLEQGGKEPSPVGLLEIAKGFLGLK